MSKYDRVYVFIASLFTIVEIFRHRWTYAAAIGFTTVLYLLMCIEQEVTDLSSERLTSQRTSPPERKQST